MALQSSGAISLGDVQTEFGGTNPAELSEYYGVADGVPTSGEIKLSDFYGTSSVVQEIITVTEAIDSKGISAGFDTYIGGSVSPTTALGGDIYALVVVGMPDMENSDRLEVSILTPKPQTIARNVIARVLFQGDMWRTPYDAPATFEVINRVDYNENIWAWRDLNLGAGLSRWDGSGTSTVILELS